MGHLSIAILKRKSNEYPKDDSRSEYLVIKNGDEFKFFDSTSSVVFGTFDFSGFRIQIMNYFEFPSNSEESQNELEKEGFENVRFFKSSKRQPWATAYEYLLSNRQTKYVEAKLKTEDGIVSFPLNRTV